MNPLLPTFCMKHLWYFNLYLIIQTETVITIISIVTLSKIKYNWFHQNSLGNRQEYYVHSIYQYIRYQKFISVQTVHVSAVPIEYLYTLSKSLQVVTL